MRYLVGVTAACLAVSVLSAAPAAAAGLPTTRDRTIGDADANHLLQFGPGERHSVRSELAAPVAGRASRRSPKVGFVQFTDTHVVDEESPLRVEFVDRLGAPLTGGYRAQEGMSAQVVNQMVREVRGAVSPVTGRRPDLVMTTGDNSDNTQLNEVRTFIDLLDGGGRIDPDSGVPGSCTTAKTGRRYDGVRGQGAYYEPDASDASGERADGPGYSPSSAKNQSDVGRSNRLRDFPGLFEAMNRPFWAPGLGLPWYGIFGNHDALIQGNQPRNEAMEQVAVGCIKVTNLSATAQQQLLGLAQGGLTPVEEAKAYRIITNDILATAEAPAPIAGLSRLVPADPLRRPLKKVEFMRQHFTTRGKPVGHGFTKSNLASGQGNFSFHPKPGLRFIVLDSINEAGYSDGNIDDEQFGWIHRELLDAAAHKELAILFAHHSLRTMNQTAASPFPPGDIGGNPNPIVHFGLGLNGAVDACALTDPGAPPTQTETLRCLFLRHRNVIAFISGHEHLNRIAPYARQTSDGQPDGGFWEVTTASHIDWPQQSRLLDLADNRDGTLSIFSTVLDHASPALAAAAPSGNFIDAAGVSTLAAISRELSYNDPQADNGEDGHSDARGTRLDRNVELLLPDPFAP